MPIPPGYLQPTPPNPEPLPAASSVWDKAPMTPEQFAQEMRQLDASDNWELRHISADSLMCDLLCALGYGAGVDIYTEMGKWYA